MAASIQVTNQPLSKGVVDFSCSGFGSIVLVAVSVNGIPLPYSPFLTLADGSFSSSFLDDDPPGTYTLEASDNYGNSAQTQFTLGVNHGGAGGTPALDVTNSPVTTGYYSGYVAAVEFTFSGFATVEGGLLDIYVIDSAGNKRLVTNDLLYPTGGGSDSFLDGDPPGTYTLQGDDNYGNTAQTSFTLVQSGGGGSGGGGSSNTGGSGTGTNWAGVIQSLIPWVVVFVAIYLFAPLIKSWISPQTRQKQLPAGTQVIEIPPGSYSMGGR